MSIRSFHKCRLCLKLGNFSSIFEKDDNIKLSEMAMAVANIEIYEGDGLPDRVCNVCVGNLSSAFIFKLQCKRVDLELREYQANEPNKIPDSVYQSLSSKQFYMHSKYDPEAENEDNAFIDGNSDLDSSITTTDSTDETDSDVDKDSLKCRYCEEIYNYFGAHSCDVHIKEVREQRRNDSDETLVADDIDHPHASELSDMDETIESDSKVSCVLCDEKYDVYEEYVSHIDMCTTNVKLHYYVCPLCHDISTEKNVYLRHLKLKHLRSTAVDVESGVDCVDYSASIVSKKGPPKPVRREIGWSMEHLYPIASKSSLKRKESTPKASPIKTLFAKLGTDRLSKQLSPKNLSFRKFFGEGSGNYFPFRRSVKNYRPKEKCAKRQSPYVKRNTETLNSSTSFEDLGVNEVKCRSMAGTSNKKWITGGDTKKTRHSVEVISTPRKQLQNKENTIDVSSSESKKIFMLSDFLNDRDKVASMIVELGGEVANDTKREMLATHFISLLPNDTCSGMMVCALATGKWLLHVNFIYDSFRCKSFLCEKIYEWAKNPKMLELNNTSIEVAKAAVDWQRALQVQGCNLPFEGMQVVLMMKKKYRQYYRLVFKSVKARVLPFDHRAPGSCCTADYCFIDMRIVDRVNLKFFASHNIPVLPYQYIMIYLLNRGKVDDQHKYLLQDCTTLDDSGTIEQFDKTF